MSRLKSAVNWLDQHLEETVLILLLLMITLLTGLQVVMRKVVQDSLTWSEELCRYCFVWSGFWGIGYFIRKQSTIRISTLVDLMPRAVQRIMNIAANLLSLAFFGLFFGTSWRVIQQVAASGQISPAMSMPIAFVYLGPLLGFLCAIIRVLQSLYREARGLVTGEPIAGKDENLLGGGN